MNDRHRIYAAVLARSMATGMMGVILALYLARYGLDSAAIGSVVTAGLAGATAATLLVTLRGDRFGRRRSLVALSVLACAGGVALALADDSVLLAVAAFAGMANGMGRDRGAALVLEQAALPATASDRDRTIVFARYNVLLDVGHAVGALLALAPEVFARLGHLSELASFRASVAAYALLMLAPALAYSGLSGSVERPAESAPEPVSPATRRVVRRLSGLFAIDALGGGFLTTALVTYFFRERFGVGAKEVAPLVFAARVANALSHLAAARIARRIGLVKTMVFTHLPSSLLLVTVGFAPTFPIAAGLFLLREGLVEMDVPTRQSYVMAIVPPRDRTYASGITHLVRLAGWTVAPWLAGVLMQDVSLMLPLVVGASLKITYDLLLWRAFRRVKPPEEK